MRQGKASVVGRKACRRISGSDLVQRLEESAAEVPDAGKSLSELFVHRIPGDELGFSGWYAVQPLSQPGVDIEGHR